VVGFKRFPPIGEQVPGEDYLLPGGHLWLGPHCLRPSLQAAHHGCVPLRACLAAEEVPLVPVGFEVRDGFFYLGQLVTVILARKVDHLGDVLVTECQENDRLYLRLDVGCPERASAELGAVAGVLLQRWFVVVVRVARALGVALAVQVTPALAARDDMQPRRGIASRGTPRGRIPLRPPWPPALPPG
jgi:hypothetical protein